MLLPHTFIPVDEEFYKVPLSDRVASPDLAVFRHRRAESRRREGRRDAARARRPRVPPSASTLSSPRLLAETVAENERGALASWDIVSGTDPAVSWCTHGSPWQGAATAGARLWKHSLRSRAGSPALCSPRNACGTVLPSCDCPPGRSFTSRPALSAPGLFAKALAVRSENVWLLILGTASQTQAAGEDACVRVFGCCPLWPVGSCLKPENWMKS
ncbi:uncharacterized protein LOC142363095 [Opisthocomus hoazin]|uniref:uncharacterized protein LOC142363095 n=1 Tax=Opisthocomus hoazin TaxID=30419 RepID=UPI003F529303